MKREKSPTSVQNKFEINPGPAKPRCLQLNINVAGLNKEHIAELKRNLEACAAELNADIGDDLCGVKAF